MLCVGVVLVILGAIFEITWLFWVGVVLAVIGGVLLVIGVTGRSVGGRSYWF
jgi:hypothetical protein